MSPLTLVAAVCYVVVYLTYDQAVGRVVAAAAALAALVYIVRVGAALVRKVDQINAVTAKELTHNGGSSMKDQIKTLVDEVQVIKAVQRSHGDSLDEIDHRLDAGEKRFQKIDRATKALEDVARTQHPESYREPSDFED